MRRQKHFLLFNTNPWHYMYENKQVTIKKPYKNATRTAKFFFFKNCWFLGPLLKNQCLRKMGVAGIKLGPCLSTIPSFLVNINEKAFLKDSFKNIDLYKFEITTFSKKALKTNNFWKISNFFLNEWL